MREYHTARELAHISQVEPQYIPSTSLPGFSLILCTEASSEICPEGPTTLRKHEMRGRNGACHFLSAFYITFALQGPY